jgi:hypothetical protein
MGKRASLAPVFFLIHIGLHNTANFIMSKDFLGASNFPG